MEALSLLDRWFEEDGLAFTADRLRALHGVAMRGLGSENPKRSFRPHHEGEWRDGEAGVFDPIRGAFVHSGSPQADVAPRMDALVEWVSAVAERPIEWPAPIVAGLVHYNIAEIHPFADGNGRSARLASVAVLMKHGYAPGRMFNFDAHYGKNKTAYLDALRSVRKQTMNQETWMQYFVDGLATEYERVAGEVDRLGEIGRTANGERLQLTESQQKGLTAMKLEGLTEFTRKEYEDAAGVSRNGATKDLGTLADVGVLDRRGDGPRRSYRFPAVPPARNPWTGRGGGRPRQWDEERIERELRDFVGDRTSFPKVAEFHEAGKRPLHSAVTRHGGAKHWAAVLGITPPRRGAP